MDPDQYCLTQAAPPGSAAHYSLRFLPADRRRAAVALLALHHALWGAAEQDHAPATLQLAWWEEELSRLGAGRQPRHPVSVALAPWVSGFGIAMTELHALWRGALRRLHETRFADRQGLEAHWQAGTTLQALLGSLYGEPAPPADYFVHLGMGLEQGQALLDLGRHVRKNYLPLPTTALHAVGLQESDLLGLHPPTSAFRRLMDGEAGQAREHLRLAEAALPAPSRRSQLPGVVMARLTAAHLHLMRKEGWPVLRERSRLPPLRMWWHAWRCRMRF